MKIVKNVLTGVMLLAIGACAKDEVGEIKSSNEEQGKINFEINSSAFTKDNGVMTKAYAANNFSIYAFKKEENGTRYLCNKVISGTGMTYDDEIGKLTGSASLPIGSYYFLSAYGVNGSSAVQTPTMVGQELTDALYINQDQTAELPEIFLGNGQVAGLQNYVIGSTEVASPTVTSTITRAVSRVDVLFIKADKEGGVYTETVMTEGDVLDAGLDSITLQLQNLNSGMNFLGTRLGTTTFAHDYLINNQNVTVGTSTSLTEVGTAGFINYDSIQPANIANGSAHVKGMYLIPNNDATATADLTILAKHTDGRTRTINISKDGTKLLPLERNKVTIVKVYVIGESIFDTTVDFEVVIEREWLEANVVEGETV